MTLENITNSISLTSCIIASFFMLKHLTTFRYIIIIPILFGIAGAFYNSFGSNFIINIIYDIVITISMIVLILAAYKTKKM